MKADLDAVRNDLGTLTNINNANLAFDLAAATGWVRERVYSYLFDDPETQLAIVRLTGRLYKRRLTPEGTGGWQDAGVITVISKDPDIDALLEHKYDYCNIGLA